MPLSPGARAQRPCRAFGFSALAAAARRPEVLPQAGAVGEAEGTAVLIPRQRRFPTLAAGAACAVEKRSVS